MTSFLFLAFLIFNIIKPGLDFTWIIILLVFTVLFFIGGIYLDRIVDTRETIILKQNQPEYEKILKLYIS